MLFVPLLSFFVSHAVNYHCDSTRKRLVAIGQWLWDRAMKFGHPDNYPCSCYSPEHIPPKQSPESVQFIFTWCRPLPPPPSANIIIIVLFRMKQHNIIIQMSIKNINKRHVKIHMK